MAVCTKCGGPHDSNYTTTDTCIVWLAGQVAALKAALKVPPSRPTCGVPCRDSEFAGVSCVRDKHADSRHEGPSIKGWCTWLGDGPARVVGWCLRPSSSGGEPRPGGGTRATVPAATVEPSLQTHVYEMISDGGRIASTIDREPVPGSDAKLLSTLAGAPVEPAPEKRCGLDALGRPSTHRSDYCSQPCANAGHHLGAAPEKPGRVCPDWCGTVGPHVHPETHWRAGGRRFATVECSQAGHCLNPAPSVPDGEHDFAAEGELVEQHPIGAVHAARTAGAAPSPAAVVELPLFVSSSGRPPRIGDVVSYMGDPSRHEIADVNDRGHIRLKGVVGSGLDRSTTWNRGMVKVWKEGPPAPSPAAVVEPCGYPVDPVGGGTCGRPRDGHRHPNPWPDRYSTTANDRIRASDELADAQDRHDERRREFAGAVAAMAEVALDAGADREEVDALSADLMRHASTAQSPSAPTVEPARLARCACLVGVTSKRPTIPCNDDPLEMGDTVPFACRRCGHLRACHAPTVEPRVRASATPAVKP